MMPAANNQKPIICALTNHDRGFFTFFVRILCEVLDEVLLLCVLE